MCTALDCRARRSSPTRTRPPGTSESARPTCLHTATSHSPPWRTWKKVVLLRVIKGEVGGVDEATT